jgi:PIN domain nuclease of toxin-antitoxin system
MKNLLDTHTFIWFLNGDKNLSTTAKKYIEDVDAENYLSIVSLWEIAIKISLGKLEINIPFEKLEAYILENNFQILPISFNDLIKLSNLPFHHRDPFDRLLIAQSMSNEINLISKDNFFAEYGVEQIW